MENESITTSESSDFGEFFASFSDAEDQSTETEETAKETAEETEPSAEGEENENSFENSEDENTNDSEENGAETDQKPDGTADEQEYTVKVDGKESKVKLDELITGYQKGQAFDRVKGQLEQARSTITELQAEKDKNAETLDMLQAIADKAGYDIPTMLQTFHAGLVVGKGGSEAQAKAEFENMQLQRRLNKQETKAKEENQHSEEAESKSRAEADIAEFRAVYPDVELTPELIKSLDKELHDGMSLTRAYQKQQSDQQAAEIARLQKELAAEKKNAKNRVSSPGSQKDTGGSSRAGFSDFFTFLEK